MFDSSSYRYGNFQNTFPLIKCYCVKSQSLLVSINKAVGDMKTNARPSSPLKYVFYFVMIFLNFDVVTSVKCQ